MIKVDQMREMIDFMHLKSHFGHYKVAIIEPAEVMNSSAANGLLKTLEDHQNYQSSSSTPLRLGVTRDYPQSLSKNTALQQTTR